MEHSNTIEQKFNKLAEEWRNETGGYSLITQKYNHPLYKQIIDMGECAIPLLLNQLEQNDYYYWFYALEKITNAKIGIKDAPLTTISKWLDWSRQNGYIQ